MWESFFGTQTTHYSSSKSATGTLKLSDEILVVSIARVAPAHVRFASP
jgi:hypothetical protein